uniref:Cadherin domain-containing protein n=1 Tax=Heterorhabditis bacteriophora TaxID=37862 RepID=A0A1I7XGB0_HETBA
MIYTKKKEVRAYLFQFILHLFTFLFSFSSRVQTIYVEVEDVDEPPAFINGPTPYQAVVPLERPIGFHVYKFAAKDENGDGDMDVEYKLINTEPSGMFTVDSGSGVIRTAVKRYREGQTYRVLVQAIDKTPRDLTAKQESQVAKLEILAGDRPPQFVQQHYTVSLPEDNLIDYRQVIFFFEGIRMFLKCKHSFYNYGGKNIIILILILLTTFNLRLEILIVIKWNMLSSIRTEEKHWKPHCFILTRIPDLSNYVLACWQKIFFMMSPHTISPFSLKMTGHAVEPNLWYIQLWPQYLSVSATDRGDRPLIGFCQFSVEVVDVNDNAPQFDRASYETSVSRSERIGYFRLVLFFSNETSAPVYYSTSPMLFHIYIYIILYLSLLFLYIYTCMQNFQKDKFIFNVIADDNGVPDAQNSTVQACIIHKYLFTKQI